MARVLLSCAPVRFPAKTNNGMSHGVTIKDLPANERPRERLADLGADALKTSDLIAILLRTGLKGVSAIQIGEDLLQRFGTLTALERASIAQLRETKGIGRDKAIALKSAFTLARRMARELHGEAPVLDNPSAIADLPRVDIGPFEVEQS